MLPPTLDLVLGKSAYRDPQPQNWVLILFPSTTLSADTPTPNTYYYIQGGPHQDPPTEFEASVDVDTQFYAWTIARMEKICSIDVRDKERVDAVVSGVEAKSSQVYVVEILRELEGVHLVPDGTAADWARRVDKRLWG
ncbi:hypothetical protein ASPCAL14096 [Aspergillus calidoustus]|uniref:Uncharacterized protein n=1 Tax=Aspergillus calidoustus TaxID=454130 RepID=A0A0U5GIB1_ASPCI|nr:hypothetical protein ASPCAL14096 [Aspergillus calidoustus]